MWLINSTSLKAGRRNCVSRATSGCVGLKGAPGNGPKPVMRMRSLSLNWGDPLGCHARHRVLPAAIPMTAAAGHPVIADAYAIPNGRSGILGRPLSRTMTAASGAAGRDRHSPQHLRDLLRRDGWRDAAVGHLGF